MLHRSRAAAPSSFPITLGASERLAAVGEILFTHTSLAAGVEGGVFCLSDYRRGRAFADVFLAGFDPAALERATLMIPKVTYYGWPKLPEKGPPPQTRDDAQMAKNWLRGRLIYL
jgi:hypothetical protein